MLQETSFDMKGNTNWTQSGANDYFSFGFGMAKEPKDGCIELVSGSHSCREGLFHSMRQRICGNEGNQPSDKTRLLFHWGAAKSQISRDMKDIEGWITRAVQALQTVDRMVGWPLTRAYEVNTGKENIRRIIYTHSSRRWMKSSYLISLYVLIVRMCKDERITGYKDFAALQKLLLDISSSGKTLKCDNGYVKDSVPFWEAVLKGYPRLFRARKMPYYWDTGRLNGSSGSSEGIQYLVKGTTQYSEIRTEMLKIQKELKDTGKVAPAPEKKKA
jgi:hypothetical protein